MAENGRCRSLKDRRGNANVNRLVTTVTTHGSSPRTGLQPQPIYVMIIPFHEMYWEPSDRIRYSKNIKYMPRRTGWPPSVALPQTIC